MITGVCLNPSFDKTVEVDALALGEVNRIRSVRVDMGGKGVNVAVVARRLGLDALCIGCMGEQGAQHFTRLMDEEGLPHRFLTVPGAVRTNLKVVSRDGKGVTELNEPGAPLSGKAMEDFFALAKEEAARSEYVVLTGSLPPGCPDNTYGELIRAMSGTRCILDAGGPVLRLGAEAGPFLIKPNLAELEQALGAQLRTLRAIRDAALIFLRKGASHVVVSMGAMGAMYVSEARTLYAPALRVEARSTVGAGDAMVGGMLLGLQKSGDMAQAFRYGIAAGAASVMTEGTQLIHPEDFERLVSQVKVQEV